MSKEPENAHDILKDYNVEKGITKEFVVSILKKYAEGQKKRYDRLFCAIDILKKEVEAIKEGCQTMSMDVDDCGSRIDDVLDVVDHVVDQLNDEGIKVKIELPPEDETEDEDAGKVECRDCIFASGLIHASLLTEKGTCTCRNSSFFGHLVGGKIKCAHWKESYWREKDLYTGFVKNADEAWYKNRNRSRFYQFGNYSDTSEKDGKLLKPYDFNIMTIDLNNEEIKEIKCQMF